MQTALKIRIPHGIFTELQLVKCGTARMRDKRQIKKGLVFTTKKELYHILQIVENNRRLQKGVGVMDKT